ncbi:RNase A-like domain-containing protein [Undibacter mobilis]|uniref:RNase A-like domain-containing protein n=1 Tax=Undibacter mobilis TaxID=2292256 RepID=UPI0011C073DC|nr:RNase A-like domain-containing protein [Undibacter mobilis]
MSRIGSLFAAILISGTAALVPSLVQAQCVPAAFGAGWLNAQEAAGGHTIARHVNQPLAQMINRLFLAGVPAVGSYPTTAGAQATITAALAANAVAINTWRATGGLAGGPVNVGTTRAFDYANAANIGTVAFTVGNPPNAIGWSQTCAFRVVLRATGGNNCLLLTSFPRPATPEDHCP